MPNLADAARAHAYGLDSPLAIRINQLLEEYPGGRLSLRRVQPGDPAFDPNRPYGVYEEGAAGRPWVFFVAEYALDARILARVAEMDFARNNANAQFDQFEALEKAQEMLEQAHREEVVAERREKAMFIAENVDRNVRMTTATGEKVISDSYGGFRPVRTRVKEDRPRA